jgi:hypothetical protein
MLSIISLENCGVVVDMTGPAVVTWFAADRASPRSSGNSSSPGGRGAFPSGTASAAHSPIVMPVQPAPDAIRDSQRFPIGVEQVEQFLKIAGGPGSLPAFQLGRHRFHAASMAGTSTTQVGDNRAFQLTASADGRQLR